MLLFQTIIYFFSYTIPTTPIQISTVGTGTMPFIHAQDLCLGKPAVK